MQNGDGGNNEADNDAVERDGGVRTGARAVEADDGEAHTIAVESGAEHVKSRISVLLADVTGSTGAELDTRGTTGAETRRTFAVLAFFLLVVLALPSAGFGADVATPGNKGAPARACRRAAS